MDHDDQRHPSLIKLADEISNDSVSDPSGAPNYELATLISGLATADFQSGRTFSAYTSNIYITTRV
jgi:hypothetical protein